MRRERKVESHSSEIKRAWRYSTINPLVGPLRPYLPVVKVAARLALIQRAHGNGAKKGGVAWVFVDFVEKHRADGVLGLLQDVAVGNCDHPASGEQWGRCGRPHLNRKAVFSHFVATRRLAGVPLMSEVRCVGVREE